MANVLTVVAKIRAAKGKGDALAALLAEQAGVVRKAEPGCLVYRPHRSTKDPDLFYFYEQYKDDAAFDAHRKAPHLAVYPERREKEGLTEGPPEVDISNMTLPEGDRGVIVIDPLISTEVAAAGLALYAHHRGERPVTAVIYTHSHVDHYGGVRGVVDEAEVSHGRVPVWAPDRFMQEVV